jgi:MFS transporter, UMF1 family
MNSKSLAGWSLYDFANTIFSAVVLTAYFPLYLTELAGKNWFLGAATTGSMILAGLFTPFFGALSDQTGRTKQYLVLTTLVTIFLLPF